MELESKFIEGTNNQYSIRNDGVVIRHYSNNQQFNPGKVTVLVLNSLGKIAYPKKASKEQQAKWSLSSYNRLSDQKKEINKEKAKLNRVKDKEQITKNYVIGILKEYHNVDLSVDTINEDLYQAYKTRILIKRKLKEIQDGKKESQF